MASQSFPLVSDDGKGTVRAMSRDRIEFEPDGAYDCVVSLFSSGYSVVVNSWRGHEAGVSVRCSKRELLAAAKAIVKMCEEKP